MQDQHHHDQTTQNHAAVIGDGVNQDLDLLSPPPMDVENGGEAGHHPASTSNTRKDHCIAPGTVFEDGFVVLTDDQLHQLPRPQRKLHNRRVRMEASKRHKIAKRIASRIKIKEKRKLMTLQGLPLPAPKINPNRAPSGVQVLIDLDFIGLMNLKELKSLCRQLTNCYSINRQHSIYLDLMAAGMSKEVLDIMCLQFPGFRNWDNFPFYEKSFQDMLGNKDPAASTACPTETVEPAAETTSEPDSHRETTNAPVLNPDNLVYLTGDSPNILTSLDPGTMYIIGGLVDHNRHKKICLDRAQKLGIRHAQLPISQFVTLNSRSVLAVNHVFEILIETVERNGDWHTAFLKAIPTRKVNAGDNDDQD